MNDHQYSCSMNYCFLSINSCKLVINKTIDPWQLSMFHQQNRNYFIHKVAMFFNSTVAGHFTPFSPLNSYLGYTKR